MAQAAPTGLIHPLFYRATNRAPLTGLVWVRQSLKLVEFIRIEGGVFRGVFSTQWFDKKVLQKKKRIK